MSLVNLSYCILDAARIEWAMPVIEKSNSAYQSLYKGKAGEELAGIAPHLFALHEHPNFKNILWKEGKGKSWGVFIESKADFEALHKHFRKFLMVQAGSGEKLYFRFYDPRVLRIFLPTCSVEQLKEFFGPVDAFYVEEGNPELISKFEFIGNQLKTSMLRDSEVFQETEEQLFTLPEDEPEEESTIVETDLSNNPAVKPEEKPRSSKWDFF